MRFVREYANYKMKKYKSLLNNFPEKEDETRGKIKEIRKIIRMHETGVALTDEVMKRLAEI